MAKIKINSTGNRVKINGAGNKIKLNAVPGDTPLQSGIYYNTGSVFATLSRSSKPLTKIAVVGDSLMGNEIGGAIALGTDEGNTARPIRLTVNHISRRIYDYLSWNKAVHKRLDNGAWTRSGSWTSDNSVFEPVYTTYPEHFHYATTAGAYVEITVPQGKEHFAFICRRTLNHDTLTVTLNGGSIAAYGPSSVNLNRAAVTGEQFGNIYHTVEYHNLPAGQANTIRITKTTTAAAHIWGGFYWSGNTLIVHNLGHGGHSMQDLMTQHLKAELQENNYDGIILELTEMNEVGHQANFMTQSPINLQTIIDTYLTGKDCLIMSCNILGKDPRDNDPNYYTLYPGQKELNTALRQKVLDNNLPFIDVFTKFEELTIAAGGTLEGGSAGLLWTWDGQHGNETGVQKWWEMMQPVLTINS